MKKLIGLTKQTTKPPFARLGFFRLATAHLLAKALIFLSLPCLLSAQTLQNRYSFVSDASDSVGGANGTIVAPGNVNGSPATIANGLTLPGGGAGTYSGYVQLPNGLLTNDQSLTIECWATQAAQDLWATIWAFGIADNNNFAFCPYPNRDNNLPNVEFNPPGVSEVDLVANSLFPVGEEQYFTVTFNNSTLVSSLFTNGVLENSLTLPSGVYAPAKLGAGAGGTTQNTLGSDVWGDPQFQGNIYELRIWNGVVSQRYVAASSIVGPSVLITNVNPTSMSLGAVISNLVVTGTEPVPTVTVTLAQTGASPLEATLDATWTSSNTNILAVNSSSGLIYGVGPGTATVTAHLGSFSQTSGPITVGPQVLQNRYSFVSDASDSVGGADGTIVPPNGGSAAMIANGLTLPGGGAGGFSGYVQLPNGILTNDQSLTIECWATQATQNIWATIWDFGVGPGNNFSFCPYPNRDNNMPNVEFNPPGVSEVDLVADSLFPVGTEQYFTATYNNFTLVSGLYTNGVLENSITLPSGVYCPANLGAGNGGTTQNQLGNDVWGDPQFQGTIYELRIWNGVVSPLYLAVSSAAGPSVVVTNTTPQSLSVSVATSMVGSSTQIPVVTGNFLQAAGVSVPSYIPVWTSSNPAILTVDANGVITAQSGGTAKVTATVAGVSATSAVITVKATQPVIVQAPTNETSVLYGLANFSVSALGGSLTFQWSFNGTPISGATSPTLTVTNLTAASAGTYSVLVANNIGSTNVSATLAVVSAYLQDRYSFISDASDSVGGANGTIMPPNGGSPATIANGLTLPGGGSGTFSGYVQLPNGLLTNDQSLTIECWATQAAQNIWGTIWAFGIGPNNNFGFCPYPNRDNFMPNVEFNPLGVSEVDLVANSLFPVGEEQYFTVTFNNSTLVSSLYTDGVLKNSITLPSEVYAPAKLGAGAGGTTQNTLGSDVWGDPQFQGTIYELRIWNGAVSQRYVAASAIVGPSVLITNLNPTSMSFGAVISNLVVTGTEPLPTVTVTLPQTGASPLEATLDTTWTSSNTNILAVTSSGLMYGVSPGTATLTANLGSFSQTSSPITVGPQVLQNRYSFVSDASDSVGGADGTIVPPNGGSAVMIANGLTLPGGGGGGFSGYVQLPNGILTNDQSLTIECWATQAAQNIWATIWDFGVGPGNNFSFCPYPNRDNFMPNVEFNPPGIGEVDLIANSLFPVGEEQYFTATYNNFTLVSSLYTNGVLENSITLPSGVYCPANLGAGVGGTTQNQLGNDVWGDPQFQGTIYELRIWNGVVSPLYLAASAFVGPSVLITNLNPTSMSLGAVITNLMVAGTEPVPTVTVTLPQTGANQFVATLNATWTSSNTNILVVNSSSGLIYGVGPGTATVTAHVGSSSQTSSPITVVAPATAPANLVGSIKIVGGIPSLVINGSGGSGSGYTVLTSTNLAGNNWVTNSTGVFGAGGAVNFTNAINSATPELFYRIRVP